MKNGQQVEHPVRPEWGTGEVIDVTGNKAIVNFRNVGVKTLDVSIVSLRVMEMTESVPFSVDIHKLEILCNRFVAEQEHNRKGVNDGNMAALVLADVKRCGWPTAAHRDRLLHWCYTNGSVFQSGVALAREICTALYGRVLPDPDLIKPNR